MTDHELETLLRDTLHRRAGAARPGDRLDDILTAARDEDGVGRRWWVPAGAAAAALAVALGVWGAQHRPDAGGTLPGGPTTSSTTSPTVRPTTPTSPSPSAALPVAALAVYWVDAEVPSAATPDRLGLRRTFVRLTSDGTEAGRVAAALRSAMSRGTVIGQGDPLALWSGYRVVDTRVTADRITVTLHRSADARDYPAQRDLAVQALVWTAQAAVGRGNLPVWFAADDGNDQTLGGFPMDRSYVRPSDPATLNALLADIWVTTTKTTWKPGEHVVIEGQASVFEAALEWRAGWEGSTEAQGVATASVGAPERGTFRIDLGVLPRTGPYTVVVFATSAKDGSVIAQDELTITYDVP